MADNTPIQWSYPFPAKPASTGSNTSNAGNPELYFQALAKAKGGFYPMGANGLWHGGVHFDEGTADSLDQSEVKCIADGEVIAYRIDEHYPRTTYDDGHTEGRLPFSTGFVLVKHQLKFPAIPVGPSTGDTAGAPPPAIPKLTFYSLYMHLLDWAGYQAQPDMKRPHFWDSGLCKVKADAADKLQGLNVRAHYKVPTGDANRSAYENVLATLPRGTVVEAASGPDNEHENWVKLNSITPAVAGLAPGNCWAYKSEMTPLGGNRYLISENAKDPIEPPQKGLNVRSAISQGDIIALLPIGAQLRISSDGAQGKYRKLEEIISGTPVPALTADGNGKLPGYIWLDSLETSNEPKAHDGSVVVLDQPVAIKAGELIGHIGQYQNFDDDRPRSVLHLQTFTCDDLPAFIEQCRALASTLPNDQKTLIKVHVNTKMAQAPAPDSKVEAERNVRLCGDSPKEGCWAKVQQYVELRAQKAGFGTYDSTNNRYPMDAAKRAELANEFGLAENELPDSADFLLESYKDDGSDMYAGKSGIPATHVRRKVGLRLKTPIWVERSQLNDSGQRSSLSGELPAWKDFPLSNRLDGEVCGYERIIPRASWSRLDQQHKAIAPDNIRWWHVNVADANGQDISGWVPEQDLILTLHSPWEWPGFTCIEDQHPLDVQLARQLNAEGSLRGSEPERYQAKIDAAERGPVLSKLYEIIDLPGANNQRDGKLTADEIRTALGKPWLAQQLSQLLTKHESEWYWNEGKWNQLDSLMEHTPAAPNENWVEEKKRIETLSWWEKLTGQPGIAADGGAWHFHTPMLVANFMRTRKNSCSKCNKDISITFELMKRICSSTTAEDFIKDFVLHAGSLFEKYGINSCAQVTHLLAQAKHETKRFTAFRESLYYSSYTPQDLYDMATTAINDGFTRKGLVFSTHAAKLQYIESHLLKNDVGYGQHSFGNNEYPENDYRGRGLLHLTHYNNYRDCALAIGRAIDVEPKLVESDVSVIIETGLWFWKEKNLKTYAESTELTEEEAVRKITRLINGAYKGLAERKQFKREITEVFIELYGSCRV